MQYAINERGKSTTIAAAGVGGAVIGAAVGAIIGVIVGGALTGGALAIPGAAFGSWIGAVNFCYNQDCCYFKS